MYAGGSRRQGVKVGTIALEQAQDGFPACNTAFQWIVCIIGTNVLCTDAGEESRQFEAGEPAAVQCI